MLKSLLRAQPNELAPHEGVGAWQRTGGGGNVCLNGNVQWDRRTLANPLLDLPVGPRAVMRRPGTFHSQESSQQMNSIFLE